MQVSVEEKESHEDGRGERDSEREGRESWQVQSARTANTVPYYKPPTRRFLACINARRSSGRQAKWKVDAVAATMTRGEWSKV